MERRGPTSVVAMWSNASLGMSADLTLALVANVLRSRLELIRAVVDDARSKPRPRQAEIIYDTLTDLFRCSYAFLPQQLFSANVDADSTLVSEKSWAVYVSALNKALRSNYPVLGLPADNFINYENEFKFFLMSELAEALGRDKLLFGGALKAVAELLDNNLYNVSIRFIDRLIDATTWDSSSCKMNVATHAQKVLIWVDTSTLLTAEMIHTKRHKRRLDSAVAAAVAAVAHME